MKNIKKDFPILKLKINGRPLCYLDNAATTQKPACVIKRINDFYSKEYATINRGIYELSQDATIQYESSREYIKSFLGANSVNEIVFTRGSTESINLVAYSYAGALLKPGQEILVSEVEHHANFVPWQQIALQKGLILKTIPVNDAGELDMVAYQKLLSGQTALVAVAHISNVLGTVNPVAEVVRMAHQVGAKVLIDGAQAVAHQKVDMQALDCDFYCFSGHKVFGPTGIGVLYAKYELLQQMTPFQYGGDMIELVTLEATTFADPPRKFEAGTPAFVEVIALKTALEYITSIGLDKIVEYEQMLLAYATKKLSQIKGVKIIGQAAHKASLISFVMDQIHPHDIGTILGEAGVAVRVGHHCSQITMQRFCVPATVRASFCFYNTKKDIDRLVSAILKVKEIML